MNQYVSEFPRFVWIQTINLCNAQCVFCPYPRLYKSAKKHEMSDGIFMEIIEQCAEYDTVETISLMFHNEPLLDEKLFSRVGYIRKKMDNKVQISITTNGSLLTSERIEEMLKNPPDKIRISAQGIEKNIYETMMKGLKFEKVLANIELLLANVKWRNRPQIEISSLFTKALKMIGHKKVKEFWERRGAHFYVANLENLGGVMKDIEGLSATQWRRRSWCHRLEKDFCILSSGDVVLCCADWEKKVILGNVAKTRLYDIWHGKLINYYRMKLRGGRIEELPLCKNCKQADIMIDGRRYTHYTDYTDI